jgi:hypothetical protein
MSVEKTLSDDFNLLIGYRYFAPDTTADTLTQYFGCLEHVFDAHNISCPSGRLHCTFIRLQTWSISCNFSLLQQIGGQSHISCTCLRELSQHNYFRDSGNLLDLVFSNFTDLFVIYDVHVLASPDIYLPPEVRFRIRKSNQSSNISCRKYSCRNCFLLCNTRSTYERSSLYRVTVDAVVYRPVVALNHAIETAVPTVYIKKCELPLWLF